MSVRLRWICVCLILLALCRTDRSVSQPADQPFAAPPSKPLPPREEQLTFRLPKGLVIELVASEPDVQDPVAMAFDERGRLFVCEMRGYPNGGVGTGDIQSGRLRLLEDRDGDGFFEKSTVFADNLRFPSSVMPYKNGVLVANAPDLLFLEDTDGDGKADKRRVLYTGFDVDNIQQLLSGLQWGLDNWVYACAGGKGGTITCPENPKMPELVLRGRGIRFKPDQPGVIEPTSGGGQYGLAADAWGHWFVATNSQHLRHIVLPDHYLARNPNLPVAAVALDIADHGAACKVHRISPFESWRVEQTKRRKGSADPKRFAPTELVPGGFITSATSPLVYLADLLPKEYRDNVFVCDPANNLIHRDVLEPKGGATYTAKRGDDDCEFLASTDTWFRPVWLTQGPDGAIYVADFYREVIETPLSLPEDMKKVLPLKTQDRGRIWRIRPEGKYKAPRFDLTKATPKELVSHLESPNSWWRLTAQRLLVCSDGDVYALLEQMINTTKSSVGLTHALWTAAIPGDFDHGHILKALSHEDSSVREQGLRLAEFHFKRKGWQSYYVQRKVALLVDDPSPKVRFQLAFTLGTRYRAEFVSALRILARNEIADPWMQIAILSSAQASAPDLLHSLMQDNDIQLASAEKRQFLTRLAQVAAHAKDDEQLANAFAPLGKLDPAAPWQLAVLDGLLQGLQNSGRSLEDLWAKPTPALKNMVKEITPLFARAATTARAEKATLPERLAAVRLLGFGPFDTAQGPLTELLAPQQLQDLQLAAVRALAQHSNPKVATVLLDNWNSMGPTLRREFSEALLARPQRVQALLAAIQQKKVLLGQLEPARVSQLRKFPDAEVRKLAEKLLAGLATPDRQKVVADYAKALELKGDAAHGRLVFKKNCATCHRLENEGIEVGADLPSILANKTPERLLVDILDPSREVDPRYINYVVSLTSGELLTGLIAAESASSITLRRAEKVEDVILRGKIESITATANSVMPDGLEREVDHQEMADLLEYLRIVGRKN